MRLGQRLPEQHARQQLRRSCHMTHCPRSRRRISALTTELRLAHETALALSRTSVVEENARLGERVEELETKVRELVLAQARAAEASAAENRKLRARIAELESGGGSSTPQAGQQRGSGSGSPLVSPGGPPQSPFRSQRIPAPAQQRVASGGIKSPGVPTTLTLSPVERILCRARADAPLG